MYTRQTENSLKETTRVQGKRTAKNEKKETEEKFLLTSTGLKARNSIHPLRDGVCVARSAQVELLDVMLHVGVRLRSSHLFTPLAASLGSHSYIARDYSKVGFGAGNVRPRRPHLSELSSDRETQRNKKYPGTLRPALYPGV